MENSKCPNCGRGMVWVEYTVFNPDGSIEGGDAEACVHCRLLLIDGVDYPLDTLIPPDTKGLVH